jgi:hypothetical protein
VGVNNSNGTPNSTRPGGAVTPAPFNPKTGVVCCFADDGLNCCMVAVQQQISYKRCQKSGKGGADDLTMNVL